MSRPPMQFWGLPRRKQRTEEEIDLDRRLEAAAKNLAGPQFSRDDWARAQYRASSRAGADRAYFEGHYGQQDLAIMDRHVEQMFWQMVRYEYRTNPRFVTQMRFISSFYEQPEHEFLERIKKRYWAQMQNLTDDRSHRQFLLEIWRAWHAGQLQTEIDPIDLKRTRAEKDAANEKEYLQSADAQREQYFWRYREDPMQYLFDAIDEEDED
jgi:hypothetical protein